MGPGAGNRSPSNSRYGAKHWGSRRAAEIAEKVGLPVKVNDVTAIVIDRAIEIHRRFGPGLLESVYLRILAYELRRSGMDVKTEVPIPVQWNDVEIDVAFRADLIVQDLIIVELKSVEKLARVHSKQLLTYLRLADLKVGLLLNVGAALMKEGIVRLVNGHED
jgi:GxxExxY protein